MQLVPYFQPIVDISSANVAGHEALARMIDQDGEVRSAGQVFTDPNLDEQHMLAFDRAVRMQALQRFAEAGQPGFLTINISPRWIDLLADEWIPTIGMLEMFDVDPARVVVEIVETVSHTDRLESIVHDYKAHGLRVAVDDFGAGSSQFDRVIQLAPDIIKLDMQLFKQAVNGGFPQCVVQSLSFLAERMGSQVLCEGVEDYNELRFALEIGSKLIQGFMFSKPRSEFTGCDHFSRNIAIQRRRFLLEGMRKEEKVIAQAHRVQEAVDFLAAVLSDKEGLNILDVKGLETVGINSVFICDLGGTQISPTYRLVDGNWREMDDKIGTNWCWRPYFYQLLSSAETMQRQSVTSRPYHDVFSGELVKTTTRFIGGGRMLMADIPVRDIPVA